MCVCVLLSWEGAYGDQNLMSVCLPQFFSPASYFWRQCLSLTVELTSVSFQPGWLASRANLSECTLQVWGYRHTTFLHRRNSGPPVYIANTSPTEPSQQPLTVLFVFLRQSLCGPDHPQTHTLCASISVVLMFIGMCGHTQVGGCSILSGLVLMKKIASHNCQHLFSQ